MFNVFAKREKSRFARPSYGGTRKDPTPTGVIVPLRTVEDRVSLYLGRRRKLISTLAEMQASGGHMTTNDKSVGHLKTTDDNLDDARGKSRVIKRSIVIGHHRTSVSLEDVFWKEFRSAALERNVPLSQLVDEIDFERTHSNLSSAIRLFVLECYRRRE